MSTTPQTTATRLLDDLQAGDQAALDELFELVYEELRLLAHRQRGHWRGDYTLNTTALVHEAYLKLVDQQKAGWNDRAHFFAAAARAMRHILINYAEQRRAQKRGGDRQRLSLDEIKQPLGDAVVLTEERAEVLVALEEALRQLDQENQRQARIVECRFYGGMTIQETAAALEISTATVSRDWELAQVWLYREIQREQRQLGACDEPGTMGYAGRAV